MADPYLHFLALVPNALALQTPLVGTGINPAPTLQPHCNAKQGFALNDLFLSPLSMTESGEAGL